MASPRRRRALKLLRQQLANPEPQPVEPVVETDPVETAEEPVVVVEPEVVEEVKKEEVPVTVKQTYASVGRPKKNKLKDE